MNKILLAPPICFVVVLSIVAVFSLILSKLSFRSKNRPNDIGTSYACGENVGTHLIQPDYSQFFPFAFFFTVLHVVALTIATVPIESVTAIVMAIIYLCGALVGISILFRR